MFQFWKEKDKFISELESFLKLKIKNTELYYQALTHSSKKLNYNYQRLEFLGDAVLNLIVAEYVFTHYPQLNEGELTKLRTKLVNKQVLKQVALKLQLNKWIKHLLSDAELNKSSIYCDIVESLIGAIYLDKGIKYAKKFVIEKIIGQLDEVTSIEDTDYKSKFIQLVQKNKWTFKFVLESTEKVNNENVFKLALVLNGQKIAEAQHYSKKQAEQILSKIALEKLHQTS